MDGYHHIQEAYKQRYFWSFYDYATEHEKSELELWCFYLCYLESADVPNMALSDSRRVGRSRLARRIFFPGPTVFFPPEN